MMEVMRRIVGRHVLIYSPEQLTEFMQVITRPKLKGRILGKHMEELISSLAVNGEVVTVRSVVELCRDPDDDHFLALCKDGKADFLITGDKDLLVLKTFMKTRIIDPAEFLQLR
ncbi:MAG: putative toxin-antitoxin system toxin component, PIN family [Flavobacteriales bacterium]